MKTRIRNIISLILLIVATVLTIFNYILLIDITIDYVDLSSAENTSGSDFLGVVLGGVFVFIFSLPVPFLSGASLLLAKNRALKITASIVLTLGILSFLGGLIFMHLN